MASGRLQRRQLRRRFQLDRPLRRSVRQEMAQRLRSQILQNATKQTRIPLRRNPRPQQFEKRWMDQSEKYQIVGASLNCNRPYEMCNVKL